MSTNINFVESLGLENGTRVDFNYPRDLLLKGERRAVSDGGSVEAELCSYNTLNGLSYNALLRSATLLLTPNGYKESKLYSVIPSNGNGDFTVTRATTATRTNSGGLVEGVPYNLLQYSQVYAAAYWDKGLTTVIDNNTTAPNGTLTAAILTEAAGTGSHHIHELIGVFTPVIGTAYTMSCYVKRPDTAADQFVQLPFWSAGFGVNAYVNFDLLNATVGTVGSSITSNSITSVGNGWYRLTATATATGAVKSGFQLSFISSATAPRTESYTVTAGTEESVYLWGAQMVEGTLPLVYQRTDTRLNIPRLDYSLGSCPNLLLEPQRTNLALRSEEFDNASWVKTASSITANSTTSPSGVQNADNFTGDGTLANHRLIQSFNVTTGITYTISCYVKKNTNNFFQIYLISGQFGALAYANFDLNNGVLGTVGAQAVATITSVGNGWYRCTMVSTAIATASTSVNFGIITSATSARAENNTLTTSVFLWGAQMEVGAYVTSYIPTTSASVTRNYDFLFLGNNYTSGRISASGGTWFTYLINNIPITRDSGGGVGLRLSTTTFNNTLHISTPGGSNQRYWIRKIVGGTNTNLYHTLTNEVKIAIKWNGTTADVFVNGVKVVSATAFTSVDLENLGLDNGNIPYNINSMALWSTPLTDTQLTQLTTL